MNTHDHHAGEMADGGEQTDGGGQTDGGDQAERDPSSRDSSSRNSSSRRDPSISSAAGAGRGLDIPHDYDDWKKAVRADPDLPRDLQRAAGDMHRGYADAPEGDMPQKRSDFEEREFTGDPGTSVGAEPAVDKALPSTRKNPEVNRPTKERSTKTGQP